MKKYVTSSPIMDDLSLYDDEKLCEIRQNLIDENIDKLPEFVQDWIRPRRVIKADNRRLVIAIRMVEAIMVRRFIYLHQHA